MPYICYCDRCGEGPGYPVHDDSEIPDDPCECGANRWRWEEVDESETEEVIVCPHCGEALA